MIETFDLTKKFDGVTAVNKVSFKVFKGEIFGYLGPNGAGKTTTVRLLSCVLRPTSGTATVCGYDILEDADKIRSVIGVLTEFPTLYERLSALDNLLFFAKLYGMSENEARRRIRELLEFFGLWERRRDKVGTFSKGMMKKLAIARALLHDPEVLFLDEPTSGLDPKSAKEIRELILKLSKTEKRTIFLCTHNLFEAEMLCNRIAVINKGVIVGIGEKGELEEKLFKSKVIEVKVGEFDEKLLEKIREITGVINVTVKGNNIIEIAVDKDFDLHHEIAEKVVLGGYKLKALTEKRHSLEDIYMTLIGE